MKVAPQGNRSTSASSRPLPARTRCALACMALFMGGGAMAQGPQLLSYNRPVYASSVKDGNLPEMAVDGLLPTRWESAWHKDPQWMYVDLGANAVISRVVLNWEGAYAKNFEIQVSSDEQHWDTVQRVNGNNSILSDIPVAAQGRYVRVLGTQRATDYGYSLKEMSVYGSGGSGGATIAPNVALNAPVLASSDESQQPGAPAELTPKDYLAANLTDDNLDTRWSSKYGDKEWIQVDLGSSTLIGAVELQWQNAYGRAFDLQVSDDGANWTTVYRQINGAGGLERVQTYVRGRFVRMQGIQRATKYGYSLFEFKVYPYRDGDPKTVYTISPVPTPAAVVVGKGSYEVGDVAQPEPPLPKFKTANITGPIPSNDWWQSLLINNLGGGAGLVTLPLSSKYTRSGLAVNTVDAGYVAADGKSVNTGSQPDLYLRPTNMAPANGVTKVAGYGDYSVNVILSDDDTAKMTSTLVQGSPFIYNTFASPEAQLTSYNIVRLFDEAGNAILVNDFDTYQGDHIGMELATPDNAPNPQVKTRWYGVFAPAGSTFVRIGGTIKLKLGGGQNYMSLATLTDASDLADYYRRAYAFVTGTKADYKFDPQTSLVTTTFTTTTALQRAGYSNETLMGMLPHQWKQSAARLSGRSYASVRGQIKLLEGNSFVTEDRFLGLIPQFVEPSNPEYSRAKLSGFLEQLDQSTAGNLMNNDPYWQGKALHPLAMGVLVADQLGDTERRTRYLAALKTVLSDWLTYGGGDQRLGTYFHYVKPWGSLVAYTSEFGLAAGLTDHHFTYGYFTFAAAVLGSFDKGFVADYGPMVDLLVRDYANPSRTDTQFPYLRNFNAYSGHSWAGGFGDNASGNNQEAAGEALFSWVGQYLWGQVTNNTAFRDAGIYGFTTEMKAVEQYWFNYDQDNWHRDWAHGGVGQIYGSAYNFTTYFSGDVEMVYGIHWLPTSDYLTYYGRDKQKVGALYNSMTNERGGEETQWQHIIWPIHSLSDAPAVLAKFDGSKLQANEAFNAYWFVNNMATMDHRSTDIWSSDGSPASVYKTRTGYTAQVWNPSDVARTVKFSNGSGITGSAVVPPHSTIAVDPTRTVTTAPPPPVPYEPYLNRSAWKVTASSPNGGVANMVDGDAGTRWTTGQTQQPGQWVQVDFGKVETFDTVSLNAGNGGDYPHGYHVFVSTDGEAWGQPVASGNEPGAATVIALPRQSARFVRIVQTAVSDSWWSVTELKIANFGGANTPVVTPPEPEPQPTGPIERSGWSITAFASAGNDVPQKMLDNDYGSFWASSAPQQPGQWVQVDMGKSLPLDTVVMDAGSTNTDAARGYELYLSSDGQQWGSPVVAQAAAVGGKQAMVFPLQSARYFKIVQTGSTNYWWAIADLSAAFNGGPLEEVDRHTLTLTASNTGGDEAPARMIDGQLNTRWTTGAEQKPGQWIQIDLGASQPLKQLDINSNGDDYARGYELQASDDGATWDKVTEGQNTSSYLKLPLGGRSARFLRLIQTGTAPRWWSIAEISVFR